MASAATDCCSSTIPVTNWGFQVILRYGFGYRVEQFVVDWDPSIPPPVLPRLDDDFTLADLRASGISVPLSPLKNNDRFRFQPQRAAFGAEAPVRPDGCDGEIGNELVRFRLSFGQAQSSAVALGGGVVGVCFLDALEVLYEAIVVSLELGNMSRPGFDSRLTNLCAEVVLPRCLDPDRLRPILMKRERASFGCSYKMHTVYGTLAVKDGLGSVIMRGVQNFDRMIDVITGLCSCGRDELEIWGHLAVYTARIEAAVSVSIGCFLERVMGRAVYSKSFKIGGRHEESSTHVEIRATFDAEFCRLVERFLPLVFDDAVSALRSVGMKSLLLMISVTRHGDCTMRVSSKKDESFAVDKECIDGMKLMCDVYLRFLEAALSGGNVTLGRAVVSAV